MRILQINTTVNFGSTGKIAEEIGKSAIEKGHESIIAYGRKKRQSDSLTFKIGSSFEMYIHGIQSLLFDKHGLGSRNPTNNLIKFIFQNRPDAIGLHNLHGYYLNYELLFKCIKELNIPVIWTFHDCWPFTGHCSHFERIGCEKWQSHCHNCPLHTAYPKSIVDRSFQNFKYKMNAFTGVDKLLIVTPSEWLANLVRKSFLKDYPIAVIHNGIDLKKFIKSESSNSEKILLGVANVWTKQKGLDDFIRLRRELDDSWELVLIGMTRIQINNLPPGINGLERTKSIEDLVEWYNKANVFINLSYSDNFPTTNIESLACGTPVITYNTGGSPEAVDSKTGFVVQKGDIKGILESINTIEQKGKKHYSKACRERVEINFDKEIQYQKYINFYQDLVNESK